MLIRQLYKFIKKWPQEDLLSEDPFFYVISLYLSLVCIANQFFKRFILAQVKRKDLTLAKRKSRISFGTGIK
jgi:hypothetical protein